MTGDRADAATGPAGGLRESAVRGLIGGLSFLVLAQGYRLATDSGPGLATLLVVGVGVGVTATAATWLAARGFQKRRL